MICNTKLVAMILVVVIFGTGCASTYLPQEPGRVSFILDGPGFALYKDGTRYGAGGFSSDPVRAVAGNPVAEEHARTYVSRSRLFWSLYGFAIGSLVTAAIVHGNDPDSHVHRGVADGFLIAGLAAFLASPFVAATAPRHLYDAVNIYNDGVSRTVKP